MHRIVEAMLLLKCPQNTGYSLENSLTIFICSGELRLMGYCWRTYFKVLEVPFLVQDSQAFLPSKQAWCAVKAYCKNVERPRGIQVSREPLELSMADHFAM